MAQETRNAVVCISGGVDSVTTTYYVRKVINPPKIMLIFCNYGQRTYSHEEFCIQRLPQLLDTPLNIIHLGWLGEISTSLLTHAEKDIPETRSEDLWEPQKA